MILVMIKKINLSILIIFLLLGTFWAFRIFTKKNTIVSSNSKVTTPDNSNNTPNNTDKFNKKMYSITEPTSLWFVANKHYSLPITYTPNDLIVPSVPLRLAASEQQMHLRTVLQTDLINLFNDAKITGLQLQLGSGFRSATYQKTLYDGYVNTQGITEADRSSARPGHSEHQTGLALDFTRIDAKCHLDACLADLPEGKWLADNAYKYGFILRYTSDKEQVTGYMFEPWHYRYVGHELALEMHNTGIKTLEEFFDLGPATDYIK